MDTNAKKFKYSTFCKFLCVLLCLITALSACFMTAGIVLSSYYKSNEDIEKDWTALTTVKSSLASVSEGLVRNALLSDIQDDYQALIESKKEKAVDSVYKKIKKLVDESGYDFSVNGDGAVVNSSAGYSYDNFESFYSSEIDRSITYNVSTADFDFHGYEAYAPETTFYYFPDKADSYAELYSDIEYAYDSFVTEKTEVFSYLYDVYYDYVGASFCVLKDGEVVNQNVTDITEQNITEKQYYLIVENGEITVSPDFDSSVVAYVSKNATLPENENYTLYLYIDTNGANSYTFIRDLYSAVQQVNAKFYPLLFADIICIVASFALAFYYFGITGKKREEDFATLRFSDYVFLELQLAMAGGLGFGAYVLFAWIYDDGYDFSVTVLAYLVLCSAIWALLFMFSASTARYIKSDKKFYKHFLVYWILFALYKALVVAPCRLVKKIKAAPKKESKLWRYKPGVMKRNIIFMITLYFLFNVLAICLIDLFIFIFFPVAILLIIAYVALNIVVLKKAIIYIKSLDIIIDASSRHENVPLDIAALPDSLRVLAESMQYTNEQLNIAVSKAIKDERLKTELITNVSHDLKTPLTSIITYVDLLSKCDIDDEKAREYISVLDEKGAKLKRLIDDLIEASKVTTGNIAVNLSPMNLSELCLQATVDAQSDFEKSGLELVVKQGEGESVVFADGAMTYRVIENLLSNARKYSAKGTRVYVSVYNDGENGVFEIKNISAEPLNISPDELTQRFVRGDKSRNKDGNGLGLSIAKELCRVQNGSLDITIDGDLFKAKAILPMEH